MRTTDRELILRLSQGDDTVISDVYDAYADQLFYYLFSKTGDKDQSEDLLQDVFVEFWNKRLEVERSIYGFLFHISKCLVLNYFRSVKVREKYLIHFSSYLQDVNTITPETSIEVEEMIRQIESLVSKLPHQCRKVFIMSRFEHKSNDEIAAQLKISKRTVENYITKSLAFIREHNITIYLILVHFINEE